jgi:hypothetical protein
MVHRSLVLARQIHFELFSFDFDLLHFLSEYLLQGRDWRLIIFYADVQLREVP